MYGKIIDNVFRPAPHHLIIGGAHIYNPTDAMLEAEGYKPVVFTDAPEAPEGYYAVVSWTETEDVIQQVWTLEKQPDDISPEYDISPEEAHALTRYINEQTGANDRDIVAAAETLIKNILMEE